MKAPTVRNLAARLARIESLTASQFSDLDKAAARASSEFCRLFIEAGRGNDRPSDIRAAAALGDALAAAYVVIMDAELTIRFEREWRLRYSGTLKPWRKAV
jgi:hypothetical protein